jgi:hypothetical protein
MYRIHLTSVSLLTLWNISLPKKDSSCGGVRHTAATLETRCVAVFLTLEAQPHSHALLPTSLRVATTDVTCRIHHHCASSPCSCCCRAVVCDLVTSSCRNQTSRFQSSALFRTASTTPVEHSSLPIRASLREYLHRVAQGPNNLLLTGHWRCLPSSISLNVSFLIFSPVKMSSLRDSFKS